MCRARQILFMYGLAHARTATMAAWLGVIVVGCVAGVLGGASNGLAGSHFSGPLDLDDRPQPLQSQQQRSEADQDRVKALALFAAGHMNFEREEYEKAVERFARAVRYDPDSRTLLENLLRVAVDKDPLRATRFAPAALKLPGIDPALLRRLGIRLSESGEYAQAIACYEKAVALRKDSKEPEGYMDLLFRLEMGRLYYLLEKYKPAAEQFARILYALDHPAEFGSFDDDRKAKLLSRPEQVYEMFGETFLLADRLDEAAAAFKKANQAVANEPVLQLNLARVALRQGKAAEALAGVQPYFDKHLATEGTSPYELLAEALKKLGREKETLERLEKLHAADRGNVPLSYFLAEQYRKAEQIDKAEQLYAELVIKAPTAAAYRALAAMYVKRKHVEGLLDLLGVAVEKTGTLELFSKDSKSISGDAAMMSQLVELARKRLKDEPKKAEYGMRLAVALLAMDAKQFDTAAEFFRAAEAARPKNAAEVALLEGVGLLLADRAADAARVFQRAIDAKVLTDDNPAFYFYLSGSLALSNQNDAALEAARKAGGGKKPSARFVSRVPWVLYHAKRYEEALAAYKELVAKYDGDITSLDNREILREARLALSNLCVLLHRNAESEEWLEQVLDEFPDDVSADNDLGYLWADANKHLQRALAMIQRAVAAEPENAAYRDSLGWIYFRLGRFAEAAVELEKAAAEKDVDGVVLEHLGDAYARSTQPDKARAAWQRAAAAFRRDKEDEKATKVEKKVP